MDSRFLLVDGIRTHYFDAGVGSPVVLLHAGDFGGRAQSSWSANIGPLAERFRVVAPDWLGFGQTDKLFDFVSQRARMMAHMRRFLEVMELREAHFVGNSMGATLLVAAVAARDPGFRPLSITIASGGGFVPDNEARRALLDYDCTIPAMERMLQAMFHDPRWWQDADYVQLRHSWTLEPGVWESCAASRFKSPALPPRAEFGQPDTIPYENITCPTLIIAGAEDRLRLPGYADELARRISGSELVVFPDTGHCPNIERAEDFNRTVIQFIERVDEQRGKSGR